MFEIVKLQDRKKADLTLTERSVLSVLLLRFVGDVEVSTERSSIIELYLETLLAGETRDCLQNPIQGSWNPRWLHVKQDIFFRYQHMYLSAVKITSSLHIQNGNFQEPLLCPHFIFYIGLVFYLVTPNWIWNQKIKGCRKQGVCYQSSLQSFHKKSRIWDSSYFDNFDFLWISLWVTLCNILSFTKRNFADVPSSVMKQSTVQPRRNKISFFPLWESIKMHYIPS